MIDHAELKLKHGISNQGFIILKTRWRCANLFQPIKGFHFLRLHRIKWAMCENRYLYIGIKVKARVSSLPRPQHPISLVYPLIVTLLWCFNTVLYLWSRFILSCFVMLYYLYPIYVLCKCIHNVKINITEKPWNNVDICKLTFNWIQKFCNDLPSTACIITSNQLEWNALVLDCDSHIRLWY